MESSCPNTSAALRASVVIATYNRCAMLERVLNALARQTIPAGTFDVLVVADGCVDDTALRCRRLACEMPFPLRVIEQANAGPAEARNRGVLEARGGLICFLDDDVVPDEGLMAAHLAVHASDGSDYTVALGPALPPRDVRLSAWGAWDEQKLLNEYVAMKENGNRAAFRQFYTGNTSLARRHILESGGFDPTFRREEDVELGRRLEARGCTFLFLPDALGWHYTNHSFASWIGRAVASGRATADMSRIHGKAALIDAAREYNRRNAVVKIVLRICLGSPVLVALMTRVLHVCAVAGWMLHSTFVAQASCSVGYNLRFYDALASAIGGRRRFFQIVRAAPPTLEARGERVPATSSAERVAG